MVEDLQDKLEPYWEDVDGLIEQAMQPIVPHKCFKYFEACRFKLKSLWYLTSRVSELDEEYGQLLDRFLAAGNFTRFTPNDDGSSSYFPYFEALEFENLLSQGKACLDCFAKAVGSTFGNLPNNVSSLVTVLRQEKGRAVGGVASELLNKIATAESRLKGVVLDPGREGKTSIRDLISHRERAMIHFRINKAGRTAFALVRSDHPGLVRLPNYRVTELSNRVWYHTHRLIAESFPIVLKLWQGRMVAQCRIEDCK